MWSWYNYFFLKGVIEQFTCRGQYKHMKMAALKWIQTAGTKVKRIEGDAPVQKTLNLMITMVIPELYIAVE